MDYNTSRNHLILPEYGRNIQRLVETAVKLETKEERNNAAQAIIHIMGNIHPHLRDVSDFNHKLWDHLQLMAKFQLDIDSPFPTPEIEPEEKIKRIDYPSHKIRYKHFGRIIESLIELAVNESDEDKKQQLTLSVVNQMRKSYYIWGKEGINDEMIFNAISEISKGQLAISDEIKNSTFKREANNSNSRSTRKRLNRKK
ncbi:MAG: DUF4290 domain-containing protein [Bacteroidales bacterium]|nr:DUF4290 domain-containing protein [Bacteroidales bacterium]